MDWAGLTNLPSVGWPTAIALAIAMAGLMLGSWHESRKRRAKELQDAENDYKDAVASRDPDRIRLAAVRLRLARRQAP
jgi:FtsZ-interacting cell division protein ZipA